VAGSKAFTQESDSNFGWWITCKQITDNMFHLKKGKKVEKTKEGLFIAL